VHYNHIDFFQIAIGKLMLISILGAFDVIKSNIGLLQHQCYS